MLICCPFCRTRQFATQMRLACIECGKALRIRRLLPRRAGRISLQVVRALVLVLAGFALARLSAPDPNPVEIAAPAPPAPSPPPAYVGPGPLPWDARAAETIERLEAELGPGRFEFSTAAPPFLLAMERAEGVDRGRGERYAGVLRRLTDRYMSAFQVPMQLGEVRAALPVVVFLSSESDGAPADVVGRYAYAQGRTLMIDDPRQWRRVLAHEATHQLVHAASRGDGRITTWFQEGIAMLFETDADLLAINRARRAGWREAPKVPMIELVGLDMERFWERLPREGAGWARDCYAESWGLAYFLLMKHRAAFHTLFRLELEGRGGAAAFERVVSRTARLSLEAFEAEWLQYMRSLP